jgi:hypothetical protein
MNARMNYRILHRAVLAEVQRLWAGVMGRGRAPSRSRAVIEFLDRRLLLSSSISGTVYHDANVNGSLDGG